jgi:hypothetical protein
MMMSIRLGVTVVAATFLFGSVSSLKAGGSAPATVASPGSIPATRLADLVRQAPVGHRQPRRGDVLESAQMSPEDTRLRQLDDEIDRRLIICRGC